MRGDERVAGYLGRVMDDVGDPIGTCFQIADRVVVTAWHVLDDLGAGDLGAFVRVDPLRGGDPTDARVAAVDPRHDLAVLSLTAPLPASTPGLAATDKVELTAWVSVTGVPVVEDRHTYRHLDAPGRWAGGATRDDQVRWGRLISSAVMKGMSGAPVMNAAGMVVGVVSARYVSGDGWLRDTVWVVRTEDLAPLLAGLTDVVVAGRTWKDNRQGPCTLRNDIRDFTGRTAIVDRLIRSLDSGDASAVIISTITGMGGLGKSVLATHVAHRLAAAFPDAQLWVDLRGADAEPVDPGEILTSLLSELGVPMDSIPRELRSKEARLRSTLSGKRALLVLDNAFNEGQVRPLLPGSRTCAVLITSRSRLAGLEGADRLELGVLDPEEAVQLLLRAGDCARETIRMKDAHEVVKLCGYLPLAVRIVAAHAHKGMQRLIERLTEEHSRLGYLEIGDQEVRASFALSYRDLNPEEARFFRLLGLFQGADFSSSLAAAAYGSTEDRAQSILERLWAVHHLLESKDNGRYRLHDLVRLFAQELLDHQEAGTEQRAAKLRCAAYYQEFLVENGGNNAQLAAQGQNVLAAIEWVYEATLAFPDERRIGATLVSLVNTYARYLGATANLEVRVLWGERAAKSASTLSDPEIVARLYSSTLAWPLLQLGRHEEARRYANLGLAAARNCNNLHVADKWIAHSARMLAGAARDEKLADESHLWAIEAASRSAACGDAGLARGAVMDLGYADLLRRSYAEAEARFRELLEYEEEHQDNERIANRSFDVALAVVNRAKQVTEEVERNGLCQQANLLYKRGLAIGQALDHSIVISEGEAGLAMVNRLLGEDDQYQILIQSSRQRLDELGVRRPPRAEQFTNWELPE
jgi:hypothetical protein